MRFLIALALLFALLAGCKHAPTTPTGDGSAVTAPPKATPYQTRRDAACKKLGQKQTSCALADAKAALAKGEVTQKDFDENTKPEILAKNTDEATIECEKITTTYQLRVVEVCLDKEPECEPFNACLAHINDKQPAK